MPPHIDDNALMKRDTLLDFFADRICSTADFLEYDDGYRAYTYSYDTIRHAARQFSRRLVAAGLQPHANVIIWSENRPEWVVAMWGCWLAQCVIVPVDYRASTDLLSRVASIVEGRVVLVGNEVPVPAGDVDPWPLKDLLAPDRIDNGVPLPADRADGSTTPARLAEIIFTSGATAEPKGVQLTHQNILANIVPVEREILKYRAYGRPFFPLRFLNLLPLSHMFGQAMATFIPPILPGVTVFMHGYNPSEIVKQIRTRRISVLVCVPKMLEVLRDHLRHVLPDIGRQSDKKEHVALRWWRYRQVHRLFGMKFWAFVVGAAPLDPELEAFWSRLGFLVIQGYGLTETAPIVTLNHPFRARQGTVGTPIGGVEVKIAPDGEILVRGENVTSGYYNAPDATTAAFEDGWFHTGDIGAIDAAGRLSVRGRKKEVIVTPDGLNVFPEDVERVLLDIAGVRDAAVVGVMFDGKERVHATLVVEPGADVSTVVRQANARLEDHQKVRGFSLWPGDELPRTEGTQKLKRSDLRRWVESGASPSAAQSEEGDRSAQAIVQRLAGERKIHGDTTLEELGLSSLERIELTMALEQQFDRSIDDQSLGDASTVADLEALVTSAAASSARTESQRDQLSDFPSWNRRWPARVVRRAALATCLLPLTRIFARTTVQGLDRLASTSDPVVYAANHQSHMDGPVILAALPAERRRRVATAAAKEFFAAHFHPERYSWRQRATSSFNYYLGSLLFNVFPLPQREAGTRQAIRYLGELLSTGNSVLIFPEGRRTETGEIDRFQPGIGMIAARLQAPIIPVRIEGLDRILHQSWRMARPGQARVTFGEPLRLEGEDYEKLTRQVEDAVRSL